ncbi:MAG TPA: GNAT family protein [Solirubrobacteraceae bacterium]|nr:GNAT family protein [Solirubrobacteraceae bacterium]
MIDQPLATRAPRPLQLRTLTPDDAEAVARHAAADLEHLRVHLRWPEPASVPAGAREWLELYARGDDGRVVVAGVLDSDEIVGGALLLHYDAEMATVELGCWAGSSVQGLGVARAACAALIAYARAELGVERIEWRCTTVNTRSRALAERLGFRHEGTLRSDFVMRGERYDSHVLSLVGAEIDAVS